MIVYAVMYRNDWDEPIVDCLCKTLELANNRIKYLRELDYECVWIQQEEIVETKEW